MDHLLIRGRRFPCIDFGDRGGPAVLALHGSFGRGSVFERLARLLHGAARVVALDQRGHGHSPKHGPFDRAEFVADAAEATAAVGGGEPVVVLGHSLGGITAYQLAAWHPDLVRALIIEDVGPVMRSPEVARPVLDVHGWPHRAATREALATAIEARGVSDASYFMRSAVETDQGWELLFDWEQMMQVQHGGVGDWWDDWLASRCPALVLHGHHSTLLPTNLARAMGARRPHTELVEFPAAGHWLHDDDPAGVATAIATFLSSPQVIAAI